MKKLCFSLLIILSCTLAGCSFNDLAIHPESSPKNLQSILLSAEQGAPESQTWLGVNYYHGGNGLPKNFQKAKYWFEKAAVQGHAPAQYFLGAMYQMGDGVTQNYKKAKEWHEKAAHQGHAPSQTQLGFIYTLGQGV